MDGVRDSVLRCGASKVYARPCICRCDFLALQGITGELSFVIEETKVLEAGFDSEL